jgi:Uma2 family endonuclease
MPGPEIRFRVPGNEANVRQPDIAMTLDPNLPVTERGATPRVPDVIVEVKSPDDSNDALRDKARFYTANGARLVWLVFLRPQIVEVYRPGVSSEILTVTDILTGFEVLPGFALPVATLFSGRGEK